MRGDIFTIIRQGLGMLLRRQRIRFTGVPRYEGDVEDICRSVVRTCWNGRYFQTSAGHFNVFYLRDFSWCVQPLLNQGYTEEVKQSLDYALRCFHRYRRIGAIISQGGRPFDFPTYAIDSVPSLMRSLRVLIEHDNTARDLLSRYRALLNDQLQRYVVTVVDPRTGMVRADRSFASIKDHYKRYSCCYDNSMLGMLAMDLSLLCEHEPRLHNPLPDADYPALIKEHFWKGGHFAEHAQDSGVTGDSNIFPFWCSLFSDDAMMSSALQSCEEAGLAHPYPLRYTNTPPRGTFLVSLLASDYESTAIWMHIGLLFVQLLARIDNKRAREYIKTLERLVSQQKNFLEVYDNGGRPYRNMLYHSDDSMLWAAILLDLITTTRGRN